MPAPLSREASPEARQRQYVDVRERIDALADDDLDLIALLSTVVCELHQGFAYFHWTGFYRAVTPARLLVGPYQGTHGCVRIDVPRGVCGRAAETRTTQRVADVHAFPGHIACSGTTQSEIVVPVLRGDRVLAVLDIDSDDADVFSEIDQTELEALCAWLAARWPAS